MPGPLPFGCGRPRRTVDISPGAAWRRSGRMLLAALALLVGLPLLWLLGALALLAALGALSGGLMLLALRGAWRRHRRAPLPAPRAGRR